jgi:hypothetical protein
MQVSHTIAMSDYSIPWSPLVRYSPHLHHAPHPSKVMADLMTSAAQPSATAVVRMNKLLADESRMDNEEKFYEMLAAIRDFGFNGQYWDETTPTNESEQAILKIYDEEKSKQAENANVDEQCETSEDVG